MKLVLRDIVLPLDAFVLRVTAELQSPVTAIFGPSGAGKTSLLDLIAGLRRPKSAYIALDDSVLTDTATQTAVPTHRRAIGYVPQDTALFPHLDVRGNLLYGHRPENAGSQVTFEQVIAALEIGELLDRSVTRLSGGEKQRVALARALLAGPRLLLLDEPMANLDRPLKARLLPYLRCIRDEFRVPMLYVAHDPEEVRAMCEDALILDQGTVRAQGKTAEVLPATNETFTKEGYGS